MNRVEVIDLLTEIKRNYPSFDVSDESIDRHHKYLKDFPFDAAMQNAEEHVKTDRFPPIIADIRGRIGDQMDGQRSKEEAKTFLSELEQARQCNQPPPVGFWEAGRSMIRGET